MKNKDNTAHRKNYLIFFKIFLNYTFIISVKFQSLPIICKSLMIFIFIENIILMQLLQ